MTNTTYRVRDIRNISPTVIQLRLISANPIKFTAGQYAGISFRRFGRPTPMRFFSIANAPNMAGELEFGIRVNGAYTNALLDLKPNDDVVIEAPFGEFTFDRLTTNQTVMMAGGIGITPMLSLIRHATNQKLRTKIVLLYSNRNQLDIPFYDELQRLQQLNPFFKVFYVIADGPVDQLPKNQVIQGRITDQTIAWANSKLWCDYTYYICGPQGFMNGTTNILEHQQVSEERIITEAFSADGNANVRLPKLIYQGAIASVLLLASLIGVRDIAKYLPAEASDTTQTTTQTVIPSTSSTTTTTTPSTSSTDNSTVTTTPTTQTPVYTYTAPVTRSS